MGQRAYGIDTDNALKGFNNVCINGVPVGMVKPKTGATMKAVAASDKDIECAQKPGGLLGVRRGHRVYEIDFVVIDGSQQNFVYALDLPAVAQPNGVMPIGRPCAVGTTVELTLYGEGPGQTTRRLTFTKCVFASDPSIILMHPDEFTEVPFKLRTLLDLSQPESQENGILQDY